MFIDCIDRSDRIAGDRGINWLQSIGAVSASLFKVAVYGAPTTNRSGSGAAAATMAAPHGVLCSCVGPVVNGNEGRDVPVP